MSGSESKPVVVGVDGSPAARAALSWAADEARRRGRPLVVISAWYREPGIVIGPLPAEIGMELTPERAVLDHAVKDITGVELRTVVVHGDPRSELTEASGDAELLVVGNRGHGPVVEAILGSVSSYWRSPRPVPGRGGEGSAHAGTAAVNAVRDRRRLTG